jgi:hypothetical protein
MSKSFCFYYQKRFGGNNIIGTSAIKLGSTRGKGSSTRMFNYCKQHSKDTSECINQFINIVPSPSTPTPPTPYIYSALGTGLNGTCNALAIDNVGKVYAAGDFTKAGGNPVNYVAVWDGKEWSPVGPGLRGPCTTLAIDNEGTLYAAGVFDISFVFFDFFDDENLEWTPVLGDEIKDQNILDITIGNDYKILIIGGIFKKIGKEVLNNIAEWDGTILSALGSGLNGPCYCITLYGQLNLYAGGAFTVAGNISANNVAMWDRSRWSALGSGLNGTCYGITCDDQGNVYAGGNFTEAGGNLANNIAMWNGSTWSALGSGLNGTCKTLVFFQGKLYAGGEFTEAGGILVDDIAVWNGSEWSALGSGLNGDCNAIKIYKNTLYLGGSFTVAGGVSANNVAKTKKDTNKFVF